MFPQVKLGEIAKVISGYAFKSAAFKEGGPVPVLKIKNIKIGTASLDDAGYVSDFYQEKLDRKFHVYPDDILISLTGSHMTQPNSVVGRVGRYPKNYQGALLNQRAGKVIPDNEKVNSDFLFYVLMQQDVRKEIAQMASGAASQANVSPSQVQSIDVPLPELRQQEKIGELLVSYDNLIENNNRRIAILEDMAQSLYREWFINFRFPGHENCQFKDSPLGRIPEGWEVEELKEHAELINYGYTASADKNEIGPKFLRITDIVRNTINWSSVPFCEIEDKKLSKYLLSEGDVVIARTGATTGYAKRIGGKSPRSVFASYLVRLRFRDSLENVIAGLFIESEKYKEFVNTIIGGAAQPGANAQLLSAAKLAVADKNTQYKFRCYVKPMLDEKDVLIYKNDNLKKQRDMLLPKLISGKITI